MKTSRGDSLEAVPRSGLQKRELLELSRTMSPYLRYEFQVSSVLQVELAESRQANDVRKLYFLETVFIL